MQPAAFQIAECTSLHILHLFYLQFIVKIAKILMQSAHVLQMTAEVVQL